jgi:ABC-type multidrug transport system permease subunit
MMKPNEQDETPSQAEFFRAALQRRMRHWLDSSVPHVAGRWVLFIALLSLFMIRVYFLQGFFIVTYGLGIYILNQFIGFISPPVSLCARFSVATRIIFRKMRMMAVTTASRHQADQSVVSTP